MPLKIHFGKDVNYNSTLNSGVVPAAVRLSLRMAVKGIKSEE